MNESAMLTSWPVQVSASGATLHGDLTLPPTAQGVIVFAHGSGSSRHSPRNRSVATLLQHAGLATLLLDLLTPQEERVDAVTAEFRFDIDLLGTRTVAAVDWTAVHAATASLPIGLFGASTGAAAALIAAADRPNAVRAVVSRGGRPDLAGPALSSVTAPTLLIVGGHDEAVLRLNEEALRQLRGPRRIEVVAGATHLFEEAGALDRVAQLAGEWFTRYLGRGRVAGG